MRMPTDIRLDEGDGNWVVVESAIMKSTVSDFMLDAPGRSQAGGHRRALVHDGQDGLTINFNGDWQAAEAAGARGRAPERKERKS